SPRQSWDEAVALSVNQEALALSLRRGPFLLMASTGCASGGAAAAPLHPWLHSFAPRGAGDQRMREPPVWNGFKIVPHPHLRTVRGRWLLHGGYDNKPVETTLKTDLSRRQPKDLR